MSDDNHTPNLTPAPALLPPSRLAAARAALADHTQPHDFREPAAALLTHLDALAPSAVDGGAGRRLYYALHPTAHERAWESHDADLRARYEAQAATLVAAGRSEGEAERLSLHRQIADIHRIADEEQGLRMERDATIARLTAELAGARAALAESEAHAGGMLTLCNVRTAERDAMAAELASAEKVAEIRGNDRRRLAADVDRLTAELAGARAALKMASVEILSIVDDRDAEIARLEKALDTARLDGAQEERRLCFDDMRGEQLAAPDKSYIDRVFARIEARPLLRARSEGQGSAPNPPTIAEQITAIRMRPETSPAQSRALGEVINDFRDRGLL